MDPGRIPEILAVEIDPDGPRTKTSWPTYRGGVEGGLWWDILG